MRVHLGTGSKKDGPSGGVSTCTAIISRLKNQNIESGVAMTGELGLNGDVL